VCDLSTGHDQWSEKAADDHLIAPAFSPDGKNLATGVGYAETAIGLWDVQHGKETGRLRGQRSMADLVFSTDGRRLFSASRDRTILV
jgi:WD40 repeat protein